MPELARLRSIDRADVYKKGQRAATLNRTSDGVVFAYIDGYGGPSVASTLPISDRPVLGPAGAVPPFFAGLLPEGRRLTALRFAVKTSADDDLTLLLAVGRETIGDVQVVASGEAPELPEPRVSHTRFEEIRFVDLLADSVGSREAVDRVALPGVQDKVSARTLALPMHAGADHFILKLNPPEFPHLVENEAFFLDRARACGLQAAEARVVHDATGAAGLLVSRFDRHRLADGTVEMRAQEDACQALGRYPADKYNIAGERVVEALARMCAARKVAALELIRQMVFAYLTGNGDQHAKNLSVFESGGEFRVTPAYDVLSTYPYGDTTLALTVDGRDRENVTRASFQRFAARVDVSTRALDRMVDALLARIDAILAELHHLPFDQRRRHKLRRFILDRASKLAA